MEAPRQTPEAKVSRIFIEVGGEQFDAWTDMSMSADILSHDDPWTFHVPVTSTSYTARAVQEAGLQPGARVRIFVHTPWNSKATLQSTGVIDDLSWDESLEHGCVLTVTGRGPLAQIIDSDMMPSIAKENATFKRVILDVLTTAPKNARGFYAKGYFAASDIIVSNDAGRNLITGKASAGVTLTKEAPVELESIKVDQAKPHAGETVIQFLQRHAVRFGLLIWATADGKVVFGRPNYDQPTIARLTCRRGKAGVANNVKSIKRRLSVKHRASEINVYGHSFGHDQLASPTHAVVYDEEMLALGLYRPLTVHDNNARDGQQALSRARFELSKRLQTADVVSVTVAGYATENGAIWAIDTLVDVDWDGGDVHEPMYVAKRTFTRSRSGGSETHLELIRKGSITVGDVSTYVPRTKFKSSSKSGVPGTLTVEYLRNQGWTDLIK